MRTVCNSIANLTYNLFGYVPAPYIYGWIYQRYGQGKSHAGFYTIELFGCMSFIFSFIFFIRKKWAFRAYRKEKQTGDYNTTKSRSPSPSTENSNSSQPHSTNFSCKESDVEAIDIEITSNSE